MLDDETGDHPLRREAEADVARVVDGVVRLTGLPSRWAGTVIVHGLEFPYFGQKHQSCAISLREDALIVPEQRWTTMIHEALHCVSAAFSAARLDPLNRRWEEAIVEQVQRLLRDELLDVQLDAALVNDLDARHQYNDDIRALEVYRAAARMQSVELYLALLMSSPVERAQILVSSMRTRAEGRGEE